MNFDPCNPAHVARLNRTRRAAYNKRLTAFYDSAKQLEDNITGGYIPGALRSGLLSAVTQLKIAFGQAIAPDVIEVVPRPPKRKAK